MHTTKPLNDRQQEAVEHPYGPLLIAAGAGSGKTHTLTSRIRHLIASGVLPERILAITFTNKAAEEMRNRIFANRKAQSADDPKLFIGTFHSFGARILRHEARRLGREPNFTIFDDDDSFSCLKHALKNRNLPKDRYNPAAIRGIISDLKNELLDPARAAERHARFDPAVLPALFFDYEKNLRTNNAFDFDDLIEKPVRLFDEHPALLKEYQRRFDHILIDEYQDINEAQYQLVRLLAREHRNLSVVGDDAQSIYAFRGANFRNFLNFERDWQGARVVLLEENYRSTPVILAAANSIIKHNTLQKQKNLWTRNAAGEPINVYAADDEYDEAEWIIKNVISRARDSTPLESMALIYRTNAQSRALEQALIAAGLPYRIFGGIRFYERKEIKDIIAALRVAHNPADTISAERIRKNFSKGTAALLLEHLPFKGKNTGVAGLIDYFLTTTNYLDYLARTYQNADDRLENIQGLIAFAGNFAEHDLAGFLEQATLAQATDSPQGTGGLNLMTIHLAKGLEFDTVFVAGVSEGTLPHHRSYESLEGLEEERRLMYVAVTRAARHLSLSFTNIPSRFLHEIQGDCVRFVNAERNDSRRQQTLDEDEVWLEYE